MAHTLCITLLCFITIHFVCGQLRLEERLGYSGHLCLWRALWAAHCTCLLISSCLVPFVVECLNHEAFILGRHRMRPFPGRSPPSHTSMFNSRLSWAGLVLDDLASCPGCIVAWVRCVLRLWSSVSRPHKCVAASCRLQVQKMQRLLCVCSRRGSKQHLCLVAANKCVWGRPSWASTGEEKESFSGLQPMSKELFKSHMFIKKSNSKMYFHREECLMEMSMVKLCTVHWSTTRGSPDPYLRVRLITVRRSIWHCMVWNENRSVVCVMSNCIC